jgi:hypothetical protein
MRARSGSTATGANRIGVGGGPCHISRMRNRTFSLLIAVLAVSSSVACRERGDRSRAASQSAPPDSSPSESAATATFTDTATVTPPATPVVSPFPADRDTTRLKATLAGGRVPSCGSAVPRITAESIGPFRPGIPVAELARRCPGLLYGWVGISDGIPVATVAARGRRRDSHGVRERFLTGAIVNRVELSGPGPRTAEGSESARRSGRCSSCTGAAGIRSRIACSRCGSTRAPV